jgi:hypothetical protein
MEVSQDNMARWSQNSIEDAVGVDGTDARAHGWAESKVVG